MILAEEHDGTYLIRADCENMAAAGYTITVTAEALVQQGIITTRAVRDTRPVVAATGQQMQPDSAARLHNRRVWRRWARQTAHNVSKAAAVLCGVSLAVSVSVLLRPKHAPRTAYWVTYLGACFAPLSVVDSSKRRLPTPDADSSGRSHGALVQQEAY